MIQYICDSCKRPINAERELRYVVRLEVYAAIDPLAEEGDDERDHLEEIQDMLERLDDEETAELGDEVYHKTRYDLCSECRNRYVKNPLGRMAVQGIGFSKN